MAADSEKKKALEAALGQIKKQFGDGSIMTFGKYSEGREISAIKTGALTLDLALGIGGFPRGRFVEIFGPESSGKSTLALHIAANTQKAGGVAAYIDAEHALDPAYAAKIGVNVDNLLLSQPDSGEEALNIADALARSNAIDLIIIDSVAALVPKAELDNPVVFPKRESYPKAEFMDPVVFPERERYPKAEFKLPSVLASKAW